MPLHQIAESRMELAAPHDASSIRHASFWLREHGDKYGIPGEQFDYLDLFMNEALANVLEHGGTTALSSPIRLRLQLVQEPLSRNEVTLTVIDAGEAFDPLALSPKPRPQSLEDAMPGGLGIEIMRIFADDLHYQYHDAHNHLSFTARWDSPSAIKTQPFSHGSERRQDRVEPPLDRRLSSHDRRHLNLGWIPLFKDTDESAVQDLLKESEVLILPPDATLLRPEVPNDSVFILLSGELAAYLDIEQNPEAAITIAPGECIGELSAIDGKPVSALVVAKSESRVLRLTQDVFLNKLMAIPGVARNMFVSLTKRMRRTNDSMLESQREQLALEHLRKELEVARQLQASMLPMRRPMFPDRKDIEVTAIMEPASEVGGDLFDAFFVDSHHLFICIGDVSGHGIPAALFMARSIGLMRIAAMGTMDPGELIARINNQLCSGNETNLFVTLFCGFLNVSTGRFSYSNGGHCAPILLRDGQPSRLPIPKGALVGAIPDLPYTAKEITLEPEDILVCFTDGVTEAQTDAGEEFSEERLIRFLQEKSRASMDDMLESLRHEVTRFTGNHLLDDDYTLLTLRRHG